MKIPSTPKSNHTHHPSTLTRRRRLSSLALAVSLGLSAGFASQAQAKFEVSGFLFDLSNCAGGISCDFNNSGEELSQAAYTANQLTENVAMAIAMCDADVTSENCRGAIDNTVGEFLGDVLGADLAQKAKDSADDVGEMMIDLATFFVQVKEYLPDDVEDLAFAVAKKDDDEVKRKVADILSFVKDNPTLSGLFESMLDTFKTEGAGSILIMFSVGGGVAVSGGVDFGVAIDIDYLISTFDSGSTTETIYQNLYQDQGANPIVSTFAGGSIAVGFSKGGSADLVVGYHVNNPSGVDGPGIDVSAEFASAGVGIGLAVGFDATEVFAGNPKPVAVTGQIKAGLEVDVSFGLSYLTLLQMLCPNYTLLTVSNPSGLAGASQGSLLMNHEFFQTSSSDQCLSSGGSSLAYSGAPTIPKVSISSDVTTRDGWVVSNNFDTDHFQVYLGTDAHQVNPMPGLYPELDKGALKFDGANNNTKLTGVTYIDNGNVTLGDDFLENINFGKDDEFSVALWVKPDQSQIHTSSPNSVVEKWHDTKEGYPFVIRYHSSTGKIQGARYDGSKNPGVLSTSSINDGQFHHVVFVKDGGLLKLYIDGVLNNFSEDTTIGDTKNTAPVYIGNRNNGKNFLGVIDELQIYNVAIGEEEINEKLYNDANEYFSGSKHYTYGGRVWGGSGGSSYNDLEVLTRSLQQGTKPYITKIGLRAGARVDQVSLKYNNGKTVVHGGNGGVAKSMFLPAYPSGQMVTLQEMEVCKDDSHNSMRIHYIKFTLGSGATLDGGTRKGSCVTLKSHLGHPIVGFRGRSGGELDSLGLIFEQPVSSDL